MDGVSIGLQMNGMHSGNTDINKKLYNGKELQERSFNYDYGFRQLDPQLGRWHSIDLLAEQSYHTSGYAYAANNPVSNVDVAGLKSISFPRRHVGAVHTGTADLWSISHNYEFNGTFENAGAMIGGDGGRVSGHWEEVITFWEVVTDWYRSDSEEEWHYIDTRTTYEQRVGREWVWDEINLIGKPAQTFYRNFLSGNSNSRPTPKKYPFLAWLVRNSPIAPITGFNPFYGAAAVTYDGGFTMVGAEADLGFLFVLDGKDAGTLKFYEEKGGGYGADMGVGIELARIDILSGDVGDLTADDFEGKRYKIYGGAEVYGFSSVGGSFAYSKPREGIRLIATGVNSGFGLSVLGAWFAGFNVGEIEFID